LKLFHAPSLKEVGWPDAPHVSYAQREIAERLGYVSIKCPIEAGVQKLGSDVDVYKKYLWIELRARAGQLAADDLDELLRRARKTDDRQWWLAALGAVDARALGDVPTSKDEETVGPHFGALDLDRLSTEELRGLLVAHGVEGAADDAKAAEGGRGWAGSWKRWFGRG
ncbi:MAG: hypothetical protein ACF8XB_13425, partial [Planctomycetota bacterium JB042]